MTEPKSEKVSFWTDAKDAELRRLLGEGKTSTEAGMALSTSKNSVIGRASRIGAKLKTPPNFPRSRVVAAPKPKRGIRWGKAKPKPDAKVETVVIHAVRRENEKPEETGRRTVAFAALKPAHCKWIVDTKPYAQRCCGAKRRADSPYCAEHHAKAHYRY
jgi:hypothetical protein